MEQTSSLMLQQMSDLTPPNADWETIHSRCHAIIDELERRIWLTSEEEVKLKTVKKQRLHAKDRLEILGF